MRKSEIEGWGGFLGALLILSALAVAAYQSIQWLRTSEWKPLTIEIGLSAIGINLEAAVDSVSWLGVKQIRLWFLSMPLSLGFVFLSVLCVASFSWAATVWGSTPKR